MNEQITLGGATFSPITNSTLEHDYHVMAMLSAAGLRSIHVPVDASPGAFIEQLFERLMLTGQLLPLLSALLLPAGMAGKDWTKATAAQVEQHLRQLTAPADKLELQARMAEMLVHFFQSGLVAFETTPSYSTTSPLEREAAAAGPSETEAASALATGQHSFDALPDTTPTATSG